MNLLPKQRGVMMIIRASALGTFIAAMAALPATAQRSAPVSTHVAAFERCQAITDAAQRLACFDGAAAALVGAARRGDATIVDRSEVRQVRRSLFGFAMPKLPFFRGDDTASEAADFLETRITSARPIGYGRYRLTLADGGAVWETTETYSTLDPPRAGQPIRLKRGALGRYTLTINGQRGVTGRRVG